NGCARCQAHVAELTEAADVIPQLVPELEPPPGFEARVMRSLGAGDRRMRRRWLAAVAAVAAAATIVSVTLVRVIDAGDSAQSAAPTTIARGTPVEVSMVGGALRTPAGWAYVSNGHGVAVSVDYGLPTGAYSVRIVPAGGAPSSIGT